MSPREHVLLDQAAGLPCIAAMLTPGGTIHFVAVWRRLGPYVQLMDKSAGRRWVRDESFLGELDAH